MEEVFSPLNFPFPQIGLIEIYCQSPVLTLFAVYQKTISLKADLFPHTLGPFGIRWLNRDRTARRLPWLVLEVEKAMNNFVKILFRHQRLRLHELVMQGSGDCCLFNSRLTCNQDSLLHRSPGNGQEF